jgi:HD domain
VNTPLPEKLAIQAPAELPGLRRIPRIDTERTATALFGAMARDGDVLSALLSEVAGLIGCPTTAIWRRDDRGRLLLARKHGDERLTSGTGQRRSWVVDESDDGGPIAGLPLELTDDLATDGIVRLFGRPFAALSLSDGILALGPLRRNRLGPRERSRLAGLSTLIDGAFREGLRSDALQVELGALRHEVDQGRRAIGSTIDAERSLQLLIDLAITSTRSRGGFVAVREESGFDIVVSRDLPSGFEDLDVTPGAGILAGIPGLPGILVVDDSTRLGEIGVGGLLAVSGPIGADEPLFIFGLVADDDGELAADSASLLITLIEQAALVLESAEATRATADRHIVALRGLCQALDARSAATQGHHRLVADTARALALDLGTDDRLRDLVVNAALVHDAGLLAATADAPLAAEFAHPTLGAEMAALVPGAAELAPLIRAHHEWWDGFGFPHGLAGEAIPLGARILAAAECYAEMLESPDAVSPQLVVDEIRARRGTQLDPSCADKLIALSEEDL